MIVMAMSVVHAGQMSSGSYSMQADSVNFGGGRSTSGTYGIEDTAGEVGTGDLDSATLKLHAGYQQASVSVAATTTPSPSTSPASGSSGSRIPINVSSFNVSQVGGSVALQWTYPMVPTIDYVTIVRSTVFFPTSVSDGDVIFSGVGSAAIDHHVIPGTLYYYSIFTHDRIGLFSSGVVASIRVVAPGMSSDSNVSPSRPFDGIPLVPTTDPSIASLTLADFEFSQDGKVIEHAGNTIVIDGGRAVTIRLPYTKVPEILKTIAVSLKDPAQPDKAFTFLLRVNQDRTAYEATIGSLGKSGVYRMDAIVLDYKNQGIKRLEGSLRAAVFEGVKTLAEGAATTRWPTLIGILILLILVLAGILIMRRRRDGTGPASPASHTPSVS